MASADITRDTKNPSRKLASFALLIDHSKSHKVIKRMSHFQSYLIVGVNFEVIRKKTQELAKNQGIKLTSSSPDLFFIRPIKNQVSIDSIRQLKRHIYQKPLKEKFKFVVINEAHKLTLEAQNALLKVLEEPPSHAVIILESINKENIIPTILSRVVVVKTKSRQPQAIANLIIDKKPLDALKEIIQVANPQEFLDSQIVTLSKLLSQNIKDKKPHFSNQSLASAIEKCRLAKEMIAANVNPKFTLASLIFSLNPNPTSK